MSWLSAPPGKELYYFKNQKLKPTLKLLTQRQIIEVCNTVHNTHHRKVQACNNPDITKGKNVPRNRVKCY